ncbi:hypothetical protein ACJX0J_020230, partial [Zea mays]
IQVQKIVTTKLRLVLLETMSIQIVFFNLCVQIIEKGDMKNNYFSADYVPRKIHEFKNKTCWQIRDPCIRVGESNHLPWFNLLISQSTLHFPTVEAHLQQPLQSTLHFPIVEAHLHLEKTAWAKTCMYTGSFSFNNNWIHINLYTEGYKIVSPRK